MLPPLDQPLETKAAKSDQELAIVTRSARRESEGINPLNNLLAMIGADLDKAPNVTRAATVVVDPRQEWVTKQVQIGVER
jgi:hypothetical protein